MTTPPAISSATTGLTAPTPSQIHAWGAASAPPEAGSGAPSFAEALASAVDQPASRTPVLSPVGGPPSITLAAALGLAPPIPVLGGAGAAAGLPTAPMSGDWHARLPGAGRQWADEIAAAATRHDLDPRMLAALVRAESGFRQEARSSAGAIGLTQLMPATARGLGVDPYDALQNLDGGAKYLKSMLDRFGSPQLALAAYNAGPGRVERAGGIPNISETRAYVPKVLRYYEELR